MSDEVNTYIKHWLAGYKRTIANLKQTGVMRNFEGKLPMLYLNYLRLYELALFAPEVRSTSSSFVHLFTVLCWNLFARSCSIADLHFQHLSWHNDALVIDMSKQKSDQAGERITPKHVYANPYFPAACPILAIGLHVFSIATRLEGQDKQKVFQINNIVYELSAMGRVI